MPNFVFPILKKPWRKVSKPKCFACRWNQPVNILFLVVGAPAEPRVFSRRQTRSSDALIIIIINFFVVIVTIVIVLCGNTQNMAKAAAHTKWKRFRNSSPLVRYTLATKSTELPRTGQDAVNIKKTKRDVDFVTPQSRKRANHA